MTSPVTLNDLRRSFGLTWRIIADEYHDGSDVHSRVVQLSRLGGGYWRPRFEAVQAVQNAINAALVKIGSRQQFTYDEINAAIEASIARRAHAGDLPTVDQPAAAPSAQEA